MKTVSEVISTWTDEERMKFSDLIRECRERETRIKVYSDELKGISVELDESLNRLIKAQEDLNREAHSVLDKSLDVLLKISPVSKLPN